MRRMRIQIAGRLVSQDNIRVHDQRAAHRHSLSFPSRQFPWAMLQAIAHIHPFQQFCGFLTCLPRPTFPQSTAAW